VAMGVACQSNVDYSYKYKPMRIMNPRITKLALGIVFAATCGSAKAQTSQDTFKAMCIIQINGQQLMETCEVTEVRDGQWRRGMRVLAPIHQYEMRNGTFSGCPSNAKTWDSVTNSCYSFSWNSEPLPGNEVKSCPEKEGWVTPCSLMTSDNQMIRITPHLLVQGLSFG